MATRVKKNTRAGRMPAPVAAPAPQPAPVGGDRNYVSARERVAAGKALREKVSRTQQGVWKRPPRRADPMDILQVSDAERVPELVPIRYGRMLQSPFTFYRGAACA